ncbi:MAG: TetR/AcrR family transcriptional regulator [Bdellovibrionales bacterium]|nr:TetR/AcrR family transcriptional regulator [Bdellovibrionales bacterium]
MKKGKQTKHNILREAYSLASVIGLGGLTIGALAEQVGMSKSGLYAHFESKEDLQLQLLGWIDECFIEDVLVPALEQPRGLARLKTFFTGWVNWHESLKVPGGCVFLSATTEFDDLEGPIRDSLAKSQQQLIDSVARMVDAAVEEGEMHVSVDALQLSYEMYSLIVGFNNFRRLLRDESAHHRVMEAFERLLAQSRTPYKEERI